MRGIYLYDIPQDLSSGRKEKGFTFLPSRKNEIFSEKGVRGMIRNRNVTLTKKEENICLN